ncbi:MAG: glycosyltransferase family 9 protein [Nitrolancea sp.]
MRDQVVSILSRALDRSRRPANAEPPAPDSVRRILVVKPCCFGDVMMATPALRAIGSRFPDAVIDVLTTSWCAEALRNNPQVHSVYRYPDTLTILGFLRLARRVRQGRYDLGVSLDRSPIVNSLLFVSGIPERAGIDSSGRGVGLTRRVPPKPGEHETDLYLRVAKVVGAVNFDPKPEYCSLYEARQAANRLLDGLPGPIVVIHPGGAVNPGSSFLSKRWPAEMFGALASELIHRNRASVVVVGADSDQSATQGTVDFTDGEVLDLSGQLSIPELAAVCERAQLFAGNDSGMSHLASAVGTPTVTIFGPTDPDMYRPLGPNSEVCSSGFKAPANGARDLRRPNPQSDENADISMVSVSDVLRTCERLLAVSEPAGTS